MSLLDSAISLQPRLAALSPEIEKGRRVPLELAQELATLGAYRMLVPEAYGGLEVHPRTFVEVLEALALGDAATGWTVMTGATTGLAAAYLSPTVGASLFGDPATIYAGVFAPSGRAEPVPGEGGFRLSGRWAWASGVENAGLRMAGAVVPGEAGPQLRSFLFPAEVSRVVDTWDVSGLRGTGSHDLVLEDVFIPEDHTLSLVDQAPAIQTPLYRFSLFGLLALGVSAVGLGIGRAALDELKGLATRKKVGRKALADTEMAQIRFAEAEGELSAARALVMASVDEAWSAPEVTDGTKAQLRLAATHAARASARAVDTAYGLGGGASVHSRSPLQRAFRDVHTMTQHIMVAEPSLKPVGRVLLGLDTDTSQL